jgi:serine/threonine protein kinase
VQPQRVSGKKSPFIKLGQYLNGRQTDPYFNFNNFEWVKVGNSYQNIGSGAFGDVYLTKHIKDGKLFAIKHMEKARIIDGGANLEIVKREIQIQERIVHENVVRLYAHYEDDKNFYLIMEYANSGTLFNAISKSNGMEEDVAFKYFIQTVAAVYFLHQNNLVHRDLKPENILVDENGVVKLCDFGWCVDISEGERSTFCGTYEYMAPELLKEIPYDFSIDVWSLGILLYELTHGYSPFRAIGKENEDYNEIFNNIMKYNFKIEKNISETCVDLITSIYIYNDRIADTRYKNQNES